MHSTYRDIEMKVIQWGEARRIVQNSNNLAQSHKSLEEVGELIEAAAEIQLLKRLHPFMADEAAWICEMHDAKQKYRDAIGDVAVTLIMGCATADIDLVDCLRLAYEEIKDRKGHLRDDGVFVKEV